MSQLISNPAWLDCQRNLLRIREEFWLTEAEHRIVDGVLARIASLVEFEENERNSDDRPGRLVTHQHANDSQTR